MTDYVLGKDADLDLDEIWEYIAADDVDAAIVGLENCSMHLKHSESLRGSATSGRT